MSRIEWTERALDDLRAIHAYIARDFKRYADGVISRVKARTRRLRAWPLSGSIVPEWNADELREVFSGQYRIIYTVLSLIARWSSRLSMLPDKFRNNHEVRLLPD